MGSSVFIHAAAAIMATLAALHFAYTIFDIAVRPKYFRPTDRALLAPMQATTVALAPHGHDYWRMLLGFHFSHSIGVFLFAVLIELARAPALAWLRPALIAVGCAYALIGWTCWFNVPAAGVSLVTLLLAIGWLV